jgi:hypothetical protein
MLSLIIFYVLFNGSIETWRMDLHGTLPEDLKARGVRGVFHDVFLNVFTNI